MSQALQRQVDALVANEKMSLAQAAKQTGDKKFLLLDRSGSMSSYTQEPGTTKIGALRKLVYGLRTEGIEFRQIVFDDYAELREDIPDPRGGTDLLKALRLAQNLDASKIVVISDGIADNPSGCLEWAREYHIQIDTFYVGPVPSEGEGFMIELAKASGGQHHTGDLGKAMTMLESEVKKALLAIGDGKAIAL